MIKKYKSKASEVITILNKFIKSMEISSGFVYSGKMQCALVTITINHNGICTIQFQKSFFSSKVYR